MVLSSTGQWGENGGVMEVTGRGGGGSGGACGVRVGRQMGKGDLGREGRGGPGQVRADGRLRPAPQEALLDLRKRLLKFCLACRVYLSHQSKVLSEKVSVAAGDRGGQTWGQATPAAWSLPRGGGLLVPRAWTEVPLRLWWLWRSESVGARVGEQG